MSVPASTSAEGSVATADPQQPSELEKLCHDGLRKLDDLVTTAGEVFAALTKHPDVSLKQPTSNDQVLHDVGTKVDRYHTTKDELSALVEQIDTLYGEGRQRQSDKSIDDFAAMDVEVNKEGKQQQKQDKSSDGPVGGLSLSQAETSKTAGGDGKATDSTNNTLTETRNKLQQESQLQTRKLTNLLEQTYKLQFHIQALLASCERPLGGNYDDAGDDGDRMVTDDDVSRGRTGAQLSKPG